MASKSKRLAILKNRAAGPTEVKDPGADTRVSGLTGLTEGEPNVVPASPVKHAEREKFPGRLGTYSFAKLSSIASSIPPFESLAQYSNAMIDAANRIADTADSAQNSAEASRICFIAPVLPHTTVLDVWNQTAMALGMVGTVLTSHSEAGIFEQYVNYSNAQGFGISLELCTLDTMDENRTFLAGVDEELKKAKIVVSLGETSLATFQAMKHCRNNLKRLIVWQNAPRPIQSLPTARLNSGMLQPLVARERSVRKEILRTCDVLVCFDKESATLAYLEGVSAQRIRRLPRCVMQQRYSEQYRAVHRTDIRKAINLGEDVVVFLQAGPLEVESGIFDTIFAFKNMLQSQTALQGKVKLVCCGQGSAGADVRQMVVDLGLDDSVYFLSNTSSSTAPVRGDHLSHLIAVSDVVIHNPVCPSGGEPLRYLDTTSDLLCAVSYGIPVITNGFGWIGEWLSRFGRPFSAGNIHSQSRVMRDVMEKKLRYEVIAKSSKKALENDLRMDATVSEFVKIVSGLIEDTAVVETSDAQQLFDQIERNVQARQYLDAINAIETAFRLPGLKASQTAWLFRTVGDCFTRLGDLESGQQNYLRAADLDPYCHRIFIGLGTVALQAKQYNVAVPHFHKAIALAPKDDMANLGLGLAFEGLSEAEQSLKWTVRACELNVENKPALYHLVKLSHELNVFDDAIRIIERYVNAHPYDVHMVYTLGGLFYKCDKIQIAQELMESILRIDPMNNLAHSLLAQINREAKSKSTRSAAQAG
jgi:tetratricopeptide (TPR) repeat protein